jgi:hypothetical protein
MLEQIGTLGGRGRRHRRRQVDEPPRIGGEAAHDLERRGGVLLADRHGAGQARLDDPLAGDVVDVEDEGRPAVVGARCRVLGRQERLGGLVVGAARRNRDELALGPAQRREAAAEDAPRVDVDRVVDPLGLGDGGMAVDDGRLAAVVRGPLQADGETELVGLPRRLAEEREVADPSGGAPLVGRLHARVRHDEVAVVEHDVADELVEEVAHGLSERLGLALELLERLAEAVRDPHVAPLELAHELEVVVAGQADRGPRLGHRHHELEDARRVRAAVPVVADEHGAPAIGRHDGRAVPVHHVAELAQQLGQLGVAAVDVADDVEGPGLGAAVGPQRRAAHLYGLDLLGGAQHPDAAEALALQPLQRAAQLRSLLAHDVGSEVAIGARAVALLADRLRGVEDDRDREQVVLPGELDEWLARLALDVRGIDDREARLPQTPAGDEVQDRERVTRRALVVLVVGDQAAAEVRRDDLGGREVLARERALPGSGRSDEHDEAGIGQVDPHRVNTAICVGAPTFGSSGPTGRKRTP